MYYNAVVKFTFIAKFEWRDCCRNLQFMAQF